MRSGGCVYLAGENGRLDEGKTLLLLLRRTRREECLCMCVYAVAKILLRTKERVVFDSKLTDKRIDYAFSIL